MDHTYQPAPARAAYPSEAASGIYLVSQGTAVLRSRPIRVLLVGDSLTQEVEFRMRLWRNLRARRGNVRFLGNLGWRTSTTGGRVGSTELGDWHHAGIGGNTIEQATARLTDIAAHLTTSAQGTPDFTVLRTGTNNISGQQALETMVAAKGAEIDLALSLWPTPVVVPSVPVWAAGAGAGWEAKAALRDQYVSRLAALCASKGTRVAYVDDCAGMPRAELSLDGVHPNALGYERMARQLATALDRMAGMTSGWVLPRVHTKRPTQASLSLPTSAAYASASYDSDLSPGADGFAVSLWAYFADLSAGLKTIYQYGTAYTDGFLLAHDGDGIALYLKGSGGPVIAGNAGYADAKLTVGTWHHIAAVFDRARSSVGLAVDGRTVFGGKDLTGTVWENWNITAQHATRLGSAGGLNGMTGYIDSVRLYKGTNAPTIHDLNAFAEQECFVGTLWSSSPAAVFRCDEGSGTALNDSQGNTSPATLAGGATWGTVNKSFSE